MPNPNAEHRLAAAWDCIRGALELLGPDRGPRANACRAYLEKALAALAEAGPPHPPVTPPGTGAGPGPATKPKSKSKPRRRPISPDDAVPFPEGWDRRGG